MLREEMLDEYPLKARRGEVLYGADCTGLEPCLKTDKHGRIVLDDRGNPIPVPDKNGKMTLKCPGCGKRAAVLYVTPKMLSRCGTCFAPKWAPAALKSA